MVEPGLSLSNIELVILNSQSLGFLIYKREIIRNSFSYCKDEMKKNSLQRLAQSLTWVASVVRRHKCLWILVRLGVSREGSVGLVGSAEQLRPAVDSN